MPDLQKTYGKQSWAIVTGGANGIGKAFCKELAKQGINIYIMDIDKTQMEKTKEEILKLSNDTIEVKFNYLLYQNYEQVKLVHVDFSLSYKEKFFDVLEKGFKDLDISILINNVGTWQYKPFLQQSETEVKNMFMINVMTQSVLTKKVISYMLKRKKRSAIINVSSLWAEQLLPNQTLYCATKKYNDFLSKSLSEEYRGRIDVLSIRPSVVTTNLSYNAKIPFVSLYPSCVAQEALRDLGKRDETNGHFQHVYQSVIASWISDSWVMYAHSFIEWIFLRKYLLQKEKEYKKRK